MRILVEDKTGGRCAHQIWVELDDGRGLQPLAVVLRDLSEWLRDFTDALQRLRPVPTKRPRTQHVPHA
jgi:hypothetical protein